MTKKTAVVAKKAQNVLIIDTGLINKGEVFKMLALAQATGLPLLLVGPPGTGKTKTVIDYAKAFLMQNIDPNDTNAVLEAKKSFMDKVFILETDEGTKSSEVKGMPDLGKLFTSNQYELSAPITEAEVIVINEVDKASSGIRNSLLGIMNEKYLFNGKHKVPCKWKIFIATCNEIPKDEVGSPFWDRFILKTHVNRINAGEMVKYYNAGGKDYKETITISIPTKDEMKTISIPTTKLEKYLNVGFNKSSDRTLTFVPTLVQATSFIWNASIDKSLVKVAEIMLDKTASSDLQNLIMSQEVKTVMSKIDFLFSINTASGLDSALIEIEALLSGFAASGKIDEDQVQEIDMAIQNVLENHPVRQKDAEIEDVLESIDSQAQQVDTSF